MIARRRALLVAALAAVRIKRWQSVRELVLLHAWLDSWSGLGAIVVGCDPAAMDQERSGPR